jgi:type IV fimbrial biogenesis protein FimT
MVTPMKSSLYPRNRSAKPSFKAISGFTLIEAITVMTVAGVLLAIGVPSFKYVTTANRMSSDVNGLLGDLQFARAEAIKEGQPVTVCPTADNGVSCANVTTWQTGWMVFVDNGVTGTVDGNDVVLRIQAPFTNQEQMQADQGLTYVNFNREGFVSNAPNPVTITLHDSTANAQYTRCLSFTIIGAMSTQIATNTTAEGNPCGP